MDNNTSIGRYARIIMDGWFKRTFGTESRKRLLILFLEALLPDRKIVDLTYAPNDHINPFFGKKDSRVDVECTDQEGNRFLVEMQVKDQASLYDRAVMYSTYLVQQQVPKGNQGYSFKTVYFICLVDEIIHKDTDEVMFRYLLRRDCSEEIMTEHLQYVFLELPNCQKALTPEASIIDNFCYALHNMEHLTDRPAELKEEIFKLLFEYAEIANFTAEEKARYEQDMTTERDRINQLAYAEEKSYKKGEIEATNAIARRMLEKGVDVETISACTGLSAEEISKL